jgi:nucleoside-diphosphate-sugar epimerase
MTTHTASYRLGGALVGHSGFVGGNLAAARDFDGLYRSTNVDEIAGRHFDTVVFSAAKAEKWRINQDPESDLRHIEDLERTLASFTATRLILISTVDVYKSPVGVDESTPIDTDGLHAYGAHRYRLEQSVRELHPRVHVVRLPGLYAPGLKKNVIYDLLNDNDVDRINPDAVLQYYDVTRLAEDLETVVQNDLELVNLATEPLETRVLAREVFGIELPKGTAGAPSVLYDMHSLHTEAFGAHGPYLASAEETLERLSRFVTVERTRGGA